MEHGPQTATSHSDPAAPECQSDNESLLDRFNAYFATVTENTEASICEAQRIRYQVYCVENQFEKTDRFADGMEHDAFDCRARVSLIIYRPTRQAIGTVRLILPNGRNRADSFPMQQICRHPALKGGGFLPLATTAEVSRFSISKQFRRRKTDGLYEGEKSAPANVPMDQRTSGPLMSLGLIQTLVQMSAEEGITHWCAAMEPRLLRLLAGMGIRFKPLGAMIEYHGLRQPCYCEVDRVLRSVKKERPAFWEVLTDKGRLQNPNCQ
jgi:N-acyl amino acid synthase of PEP-CTERM/exosortase system